MYIPDPSAAVLAALVLVTALVALIVSLVVNKCDKEDLPQILAGLAQVIEALAEFLPWHLVRLTRQIGTPYREEQPENNAEPAQADAPTVANAVDAAATVLEITGGEQ